MAIDSNGLSRPIKVDTQSGSTIEMSVEHAQTHEGKLFTATHLATGVAAAGTVYLHFTTPATGRVHLKGLELGSSGPKVKLELFKGGTVAADGTPVPAVNRDHESTNTTFALYVAPTTPAPAGSALDCLYVGGGTGVGGTASGSSTVRDLEHYLSPNTKYFLVATNGGGGASDIHVRMLWYAR